MNKEQCIEILEDLKSYVDENWDYNDPSILPQILDSINAINYAIDSLRVNNIIGTLNIDGEKYIVSK